MPLNYGIGIASGVFGTDGLGANLPNNITTALPIFDYIVLKSSIYYSREGTPPPNVTSKARYDVEGLTLNNVNLRSPGIGDIRTTIDDLYNKYKNKPKIVTSVPLLNTERDTYYETQTLKRIWETDPDKLYAVEITLKYEQSLYSNHPDTVEAIKNRLANILSPLQERHTLRVWLKLPPELFLNMHITKYNELLNPLIDAYIISNTIPGYIYDNIVEPKSNVRNSEVGISGPFLKYTNTHIIKSLKAAGVTDKPLIGCGGIASIEDVMDYERAGAQGVQLGSIFLHHPETAIQIATMIQPHINESKNHENSTVEF